MNPKSEAQKRYEKKTKHAAQSKYDKENTKRYVIKVMLRTESDIIQKLETITNKSGYIKNLIRQDIQEE